MRFRRFSEFAFDKSDARNIDGETRQPEGCRQPVKKAIQEPPVSCIIKGNGGVFVEGWRKDSRKEPVIIDLDALVPSDHMKLSISVDRSISRIEGVSWQRAKSHKSAAA